MQTVSDLRAKLQKQWHQLRFYKLWLNHELELPLSLPLKKPTDKELLHNFTRLSQWQQQLGQELNSYSGITLLKQQRNYSTMGRQLVPIGVEFNSIETLARFCGKWGEWQQFVKDYELINQQLPQLTNWLPNHPRLLLKHAGEWQQLIAICHHFQKYPRPGCYLRELQIPAVDSKFIESRKQVVKSLLDELLPQEAVNADYQQISDHGFEQRFGLNYDEPAIRFRLLDPQLSAELGGLSDLSIPLSDFAKLELLLDRVFITENKVNGLAFPSVKNALVIFGKGYGIQSLKSIHWLQRCQLYYWGDIDSDGFAMLSQLRSYFPKAKSILMDETTLLASKAFWGEEPADKKQSPKSLPNLTATEASLYHKLKTDYWQPRLRLEQERIPFQELQQKLMSLIPK